MSKLDESRKTGAAGGTEVIMDDIDNMVLDIIGRSAIQRQFRCKISQLENFLTIFYI